MSSGPDALLGLSLCKSSTTPSLLTLISGIAGYGTPSGVGMPLESSLVHVDSYCLLRMSALSLGSACSLPLSLRDATSQYITVNINSDELLTVYGNIHSYKIET